MNSDPFDSAAWRTFGMLDSDESAIFDGALRHDPVLLSAYLEMDRLTAAIAVATTPPIAPPARHLEQLQIRLGLNRSKSKHFWLAVAGWSAAAVLALLLIFDRTVELSGLRFSANTKIEDSSSAANSSSSGSDSGNARNSINATPSTGQSNQSADGSGKSTEPKAATRVETKRLIQEIEVLRDNLEKFQQRDRVLFQATPGMALPVVMTMNPPGVSHGDSASTGKNDDSPITTMLGDALAAMTATPPKSPDDQAAGSVVASDTVPDYPTAIPIYDAARDSGTLVVNNLPLTVEGHVYNLWVATEVGGPPIYVGSLPEGSESGADSFDFSLGSTMILPSGFVLTVDPLNAPVSPNESNTILRGPPTPP